MNYMSKEAIMNRLQEHYEYAENKANGEVFAIFLQGSQNYIDDKFFKNSDVDSRAIFLPNMKDICLGNDISQPELILNNGEHIDRFDIRKFLKLIKTPGTLICQSALLVNYCQHSLLDNCKDMDKNN